MNNINEEALAIPSKTKLRVILFLINLILLPISFSYTFWQNIQCSINS